MLFAAVVTLLKPQTILSKIVRGGRSLGRALSRVRAAELCTRHARAMLAHRGKITPDAARARRFHSVSSDAWVHAGQRSSR